MRFVIYGAGAIGGVIGGHLARSGNKVILIGRPGQVNAINKSGLRLITPAGAEIVKIPAVTDPGEIKFFEDSVVFMTMKSQNTGEALQVLKREITDVPIFCFQNGVRNEEIAASYFQNVYGVMVIAPAIYLKDGEVTANQDPPGRFIIGCYPKGVDSLAETVATILETSGFIAKTTEDIIPFKWGKLMSNLANAVGAVTDSRNDEANKLSAAAQEELRKVLNKAGIRWISQENFSKEIPEMGIPVRKSIDTGSKSSTWQSLSREQGTVETEFLNGEVVRLANRLGLNAPVNEVLMRISQEMAAKHELPGKHTPAELLKRAGVS